MNKFVVEPTDKNIELYKTVKGSKSYWHTADFFSLTTTLKMKCRSFLMPTWMYLWSLMKRTKMRLSAIFLIGRMIVKAAREAGISPQDYRDQFNNYVAVIWTPICIWRKDELGKTSYSLVSGLQSGEM